MMLASPRHRQRITASSRQLTGSKLRVAEVKRDPSPDTHTGPPSLHASWIDQAHQRGHGPPDGAKSGCCLADIVQQSSSQHLPTNTRAEVSCPPSDNTNPVALVGVAHRGPQIPLCRKQVLDYPHSILITETTRPK